MNCIIFISNLKPNNNDISVSFINNEMVGGGLMQLVAYGVQDIYLQSYHKVDDCIHYDNPAGRRHYRNFELREIHWHNERFFNGLNKKFTFEKYKEYVNKYNGYKYLNVKSNTITVVQGNPEIINELYDHRVIASRREIIEAFSDSIKTIHDFVDPITDRIRHFKNYFKK